MPKRKDPRIPDAILDQLLAGADPKTAFDPNGRDTCRQFVLLCRSLGLLAGGEVALDGSKFKAVNSHERNFTRAKLAKQMAKIEASIAGYLKALDQADQAEEERTATKVEKLQDKIATLRQRMQALQPSASNWKPVPTSRSPSQIPMLGPCQRAPIRAASWATTSRPSSTRSTI